MISRAQFLQSFSKHDYYCAHFSQLEDWREILEAFCHEQSLNPSGPLCATLPGTYPTFTINKTLVLKFFGELFDGMVSFQTESEAYQILHALPQLHLPRIRAQGEFCSTPRWNYLILDYLPGMSFGEARTQISTVQQQQIAFQLGTWLRQIYSLPLPNGQIFSPSWIPYRTFLYNQRQNCTQRHYQWKTLPVRLIDQIETWFPEVSELLPDTAVPHLIHADLTADHLLVSEENSEWHISGLIDFGDARVGSLGYELPALYFDLFACQPDLLKSFLTGYDHPILPFISIGKTILAYALLHEFNVFVNIPFLNQAHDLDHLAQLLLDPPVN